MFYSPNLWGLNYLFKVSVMPTTSIPSNQLCLRREISDANCTSSKDPEFSLLTWFSTKTLANTKERKYLSFVGLAHDKRRYAEKLIQRCPNLRKERDKKRDRKRETERMPDFETHLISQRCRLMAEEWSRQPLLRHCM